jgi:ATP-dependent Zn protease
MLMRGKADGQKRSSSRRSSPTPTWQRALLSVVLLSFLWKVVAMRMMSASVARAATREMGLSTFLDQVRRRKVAQVLFSVDGLQLVALEKGGAQRVVRLLQSQESAVIDLLQRRNVPFAVAPLKIFARSPPAQSLMLPVLMLWVGMQWLRQKFNIGKRKEQRSSSPKVSFEDVAGCDGAKQELLEVVTFLRDPEKFAEVGAVCPRGVLLEGPPGVGKTLLARAVAAEAEVPFFSVSGSEFVELFVGQGAKRVRSLFRRARRKSPCIIFIDEIDALGKARLSGALSQISNNDEREQTLNQLLAEMDGFGRESGILVIGATNRSAILDEALLRPGRFDRRVQIGLPDVKGRADILKIHARGKPLDEEVRMDALALRTSGFSGAALQTLMNECAIIAARDGRNRITSAVVDSAFEKMAVSRRPWSFMN